MTEFWLVANSMYPIKHVLKANRLRRWIRALGLGYEGVLCVITRKTETEAAQAFEARGYDLGYRSQFGLNRYPPDTPK